MDWIYYISTLGITPVFASRAFIPLFITSFLAGASKYEWIGSTVVFIRELFPSFLGSMDAVELLAILPDWYSGPLAMTIFGVLALLEMYTTKLTGLHVVFVGC